MGARLGIIDGLLLKKRAQVERALRTVSEQLADMEWLEKELPIDEDRVKRHTERTQLAQQLSKIWQAQVQTLKSMPMGHLLGKMKEGGLEKIGFPELSGEDAASFAAFLQKSNLEEKSAEQLHEMAGQSEQRLRHLGMDLPLFRREVAARRAFLMGIMSFSSELPSAALDYLPGQTQDARNLVERLAELGKTMELDSKEWERANRIKQKNEATAGLDKAALNRALQELRALEDVLDGKAAPIETEEKEKGLFGNILRFLGGK
jgi:hypothetical protein